MKCIEMCVIITSDCMSMYVMHVEIDIAMLSNVLATVLSVPSANEKLCSPQFCPQVIHWVAHTKNNALQHNVCCGPLVAL